MSMRDQKEKKMKMKKKIKRWLRKWKTKRKELREKKKVCWEKRKKPVSFYARVSETKTAFYSNQSMIALLYKEACFNTNNLDVSLPSVFTSLLHVLNYIS